MSSSNLMLKGKGYIIYYIRCLSDLFCEGDEIRALRVYSK
jgi:hypothetical protein